LELPEEAFTNDIKTASNTAMRAWELQKEQTICSGAAFPKDKKILW